MDRCNKPDAAASPPASTCRVIAGPFTRADQLRAFITAVGRIEGVTGLVAEHFQLGELSLHCCYTDGHALAVCLAALTAFSPRVEREESGVIRLTFEGASGDG